MFFITSINFDDRRVHVIDQLHSLQFSKNLRETSKFELDTCGAVKYIESLRTTELIEADLCVFMEAEQETLTEEEEEDDEGDVTTSPGNILLALLSSNVASSEPNAEAEPEIGSTISDYSELNEELEEVENQMASETSPEPPPEEWLRKKAHDCHHAVSFIIIPVQYRYFKVYHLSIFS